MSYSVPNFNAGRAVNFQRDLNKGKRKKMIHSSPPFTRSQLDDTASSESREESLPPPPVLVKEPAHYHTAMTPVGTNQDDHPSAMSGRHPQGLKYDMSSDMTIYQQVPRSSFKTQQQGINMMNNSPSHYSSYYTLLGGGVNASNSQNCINTEPLSKQPTSNVNTSVRGLHLNSSNVVLNKKEDILDAQKTSILEKPYIGAHSTLFPSPSKHNHKLDPPIELHNPSNSSFLNSSPSKQYSLLSSSGPVSPIAKDSRLSASNQNFVVTKAGTSSHGFSHNAYNSAFSPTKRTFHKTTLSSISTPSSSYLRSAAEKGTPLCPIHELPVDILCTDCSELICAKCSRTPLHNIHSCKSIDEMDREKECRDVRASVEVLDSRINDLEIKSGSSHDIEVIHQLHSDAVDEIRKSFERAREFLFEQEQDLISSLNLIIQSRIQLNTDIMATKQKIIQASAKLYPNDEMTNYDIAQNKYQLINSIKDKVEFLEIKLKFNGSCLDQDVQEIKEKGQKLMSHMDDLSKHYDLPSYSFYPFLAKVGGKQSSME